MKARRPPDDPGNPTVNFHGESRRNDTHASTTDPDAHLARKGQGKEAKLSYAGHVLLDNRHGLVANVCTTAATGTAERDAAQWLLTASAPPHSTVGGDKNFDVPAFVAAVRDLQITPHVAQKAKGTAIDARHDASRGVCHQSTETETDRASLRVDENRGRVAEAAASGRRARGLDGDVHRGGVQLDPPAHAAGESDVTRRRARLARERANTQEPGTHRRSPTNVERKMLSRVTFSSAC
jgi:hypothetical protein